MGNYAVYTCVYIYIFMYYIYIYIYIYPILINFQTDPCGVPMGSMTPKMGRGWSLDESLAG